MPIPRPKSHMSRVAKCIVWLASATVPEDDFRAVSDVLKFTTDDGSCGKKSLVTVAQGSHI